MNALKGPAAARRLPPEMIRAEAQPSAKASRARAREGLRDALFAHFGGPKSEAAHEVESARRAAESTADELIRCIAGPELDLTPITDAGKLPHSAWSALQRYARAGNEVGITTLTLGAGIDFSNAEFLQGLAQLNLRTVRSNTPVSRPVAQRLFAALSHLSRLHSCDPLNPSAMVTATHSDFLSEAKKSRRQVREAWAQLDAEVNRRAGDPASTQRAATRVLLQVADVPVGEIEGGLQAMLLHTVGTGNEEVTRGIARAVLSSEDALYDDSRKVGILTGGALPERPKAPHAASLRIEAQALAATKGRGCDLRGAPIYRSALHGGKSDPEAKKQVREGKVFIPALGAFVESPLEDLQEQDDPSALAPQAQPQAQPQPQPQPRPIRPPLLHQIVGQSAAHGDITSLVLRYVGIGALVAEIVPSALDDADIEFAIASVHHTAGGEMTWAQVAMENGHPGAVAKAIVAILDAPVDLDLQHRLVDALRVDPAQVTGALKDPKWNSGTWAARLVRRIEHRFPPQMSNPAHTKGTSVSQH